MQQLARIAGFCIVLGCLLGCVESNAPQADSRSTVTRTGKYLLSYVPSPDPIRVAHPFALTIKVTERANKELPVADANLAVDGWMPAHEHGMYTVPSVTSHGDGTYTVEGMQFHMEMHWQIRVDVYRANASDRGVFNVICCVQ